MAQRIPFVEQLGFELWAFEGGRAELRVELAEAHLNSWRVAHGGVLMTLLDVAMALAARSGAGAQALADGEGAGGPGIADAAGADAALGVATVEMKTRFLRPAEGRLRAVGSLLHRTASLAFCEASVLDEDGLCCAKATGTFKYLHALRSRGLHAAPPPRATPPVPPTPREIT